LDQNLANWVREQRANKIHVSRRVILSEAKKTFIPEGDEDDEANPRVEFKVLI
jgi:hypothetical protein